MKVFNGKSVFRASAVMYIIIFCSVPYLMGACNYANYQNLNIKVTTANDQCAVGDLRTFSCTAYTEGNQRLAINDQLDDDPANYSWEKEPGEYVEWVSQFYNKVKVRGKTAKDDYTWVSGEIVAEDWSGTCKGFDYIHVVPLEN